MTKKLSIIVPAYKVEGYIEKCIRSLEDQDMAMNEYEIIVTNDGSPDRCKEIVESLQKEFSNIVLINQENQGVSMARNNAIAIAKGEYILPIDPDDYVVPNVLESVYQNALSRNLDVLYLSYEIFDKEGNSIWETDYKDEEEQLFDGVEGYFASRGYKIKDPDRSWAMLFRNKILQHYKINYPKSVPYLEDGLFIGKVFTVAERVGFLSKKFYQRTTRPGSATNSELFFSEKAIQGFLYAIEDIKAFRVSNHFNKNQNLLLNHIIAKFTLLPLTSLISKKSLVNYYKFIKRLKDNNMNRIENEGLRFSYFRMASIYNINPFLFYVYYLIDCKFKKK